MKISTKRWYMFLDWHMMNMHVTKAIYLFVICCHLYEFAKRSAADFSQFIFTRYLFTSGNTFPMFPRGCFDTCSPRQSLRNILSFGCNLSSVNVSRIPSCNVDQSVSDYNQGRLPSHKCRVTWRASGTLCSHIKVNHNNVNNLARHFTKWPISLTLLFFSFYFCLHRQIGKQLTLRSCWKCLGYTPPNNIKTCLFYTTIIYIY